MKLARRFSANRFFSPRVQLLTVGAAEGATESRGVMFCLVMQSLWIGLTLLIRGWTAYNHWFELSLTVHSDGFLRTHLDSGGCLRG